MKVKHIAVAFFLALGLAACSKSTPAENPDPMAQWEDYPVGEIIFHDEDPDSEGARIYHSIIKDPETYITEQAKTVLSTLYFSPQDSIVPVRKLHYHLCDMDGISAKGGGNGVIHIYYSTRYLEEIFAEKDTAKVLFETRGVLLHELTHGYQLEPQGIGDYGSNKVFWAFIEGMADAVRAANDGFPENARPKRGSYKNGYRYAGYFFVWLRDNKDPDFIRNYNHSTLEVVPWSFDGGMKYALGEDADIDELWHEYQVAVGDKKE